jgi:clan AA aspartic protease (TIGR02281 family)
MRTPGAFLGVLLASASAQGATIALTEKSGIYLAQVEINGAVRLPFMIDTGATTVVLGRDVLLSLARAGDGIDYAGPITSLLADGTKVTGERVVLREVKLGSHTVRNVIATVTSVNGQLLLGQSFLSRLPAWRIDYRQHALVIEDVLPARTESGGSVTALSSYERGLVDRTAWEEWSTKLSGSYRAGAYYWAERRSVSITPQSDCRQPSSLSNAQISQYQADTQRFQAGCEAAQVRLTPSDWLRFSSPDYKLGWNAYAASLTSPTR